MKIIFSYAALSALIMLVCFTAYAQKPEMKIGYNFNTPVSNSFKNFISNTSFRGFNGELAYPVNNLLIGVGVSYSDFYQKYPRQVVATKDGNISAVVSNSVQTIPILAKATYNFSKKGLLRPYAALGAGMNFVQYTHYLGEFADAKSTLKPAVQGDAGVNIFVSELRGSGINVGASFNYLPFNYSETKNLNNWGVHAGIFFLLR